MFKRSLEEASAFSSQEDEASHAVRLGTAGTHDGAPAFGSARLYLPSSTVSNIAKSGRKRLIPELILPMDRVKNELELDEQLTNTRRNHYNPNETQGVKFIGSQRLTIQQ